MGELEKGGIMICSPDEKYLNLLKEIILSIDAAGSEFNEKSIAV